MKLMVDGRSWCFSPVILHIALLLVLDPPGVAHADDIDREKEFCPIEATVDLTYAKKNDSGFRAVDGLFFPRVSARFRAGAWHGCICDIKPCLAFCPRRNITKSGTSGVAEDYVKHSGIPSVYDKNLTLVDDEDTSSLGQRFHIFAWNPCQGKGGYFLEPGKYETDEFHLLENGSLFLPHLADQIPRYLNFKEYCLRQRGNNSIYTPIVCFVDDGSAHVVQEDNLKKVVYVGGLVAVPFLLATVMVYSVLPELRTIHGNTLRCYLCCMALAYVALAVDRIPAADFTGGTFCLCRGLIIYFLFLASFFWLNVMCLDMLWRFGVFVTFSANLFTSASVIGFRCLPHSSPHQDRKQFIGYSIYAWGITAVMTATCVGMELSPSIPESLIRPGFGLNGCWFSTKSAEALYFYGAIGLTIACNICLFILTSIKVSKYKKRAHRHNTTTPTADSDRYDDNRQWFSLHVKLFVVMGITWSMEIISWLWKGPKYFWFVTDMVNVLQGVLIFVIFVCKKNIWLSLKRRFNKKKLRGSNSQPNNETCVSLNSLPDLPATFK